MRSRTFIVGAVLLVVIVGAAIMLWPTLERLISPGPLSQAHAKLETQCSACHLAFTPLAERGKCMSCHENVARDIRTETGFHGRSEEVRGQQCRSCHTEHLGPGKDIADLQKARFDHQKTDFPIFGKHQGLDCKSCHRPQDAFRAAPSACVACHAGDDVHKARFGTNCASCHNATGWKVIHTFDHGVTGFPLSGGHQKVQCVSCHVGNRFKETPRECVACHAKDDVHKGSFGKDCATCHTTIDWKGARFDHNRTRFPLFGQHAGVSCASCHGANDERPKPPMTCVSCHRKNDAHRGANGTNCATCHSPISWKRTFFNHDKATRFPLMGAHKRVKCASCHVRPVAVAKPPLTCAGCHSRQDPHQGRLGRDCASCHTNDRWRPAPLFSHATTNFPLTGRHVLVTCASCHRDKRFQSAGTSCASCHADTAHRGRFGTPANCASCHTTATWEGARFDHDRTRFSLTGKHARLSCNACHTAAARTARLPVSCVSCHKADDPHEGRFGNRCENCHTSGETFKTVRVPSTALKLPVPRSWELQ